LSWAGLNDLAKCPLLNYVKTGRRTEKWGNSGGPMGIQWEMY
jgi:hypothetical protein